MVSGQYVFNSLLPNIREAEEQKWAPLIEALSSKGIATENMGRILYAYTSHTPEKMPYDKARAARVVVSQKDGGYNLEYVFTWASGSDKVAEAINSSTPFKATEIRSSGKASFDKITTDTNISVSLEEVVDAILTIKDPSQAGGKAYADGYSKYLKDTGDYYS